MRDGFIKVAAVTPKIQVADVAYNTEQIRDLMEEAAGEGAIPAATYLPRRFCCGRPKMPSWN